MKWRAPFGDVDLFARLLVELAAIPLVALANEVEPLLKEKILCRDVCGDESCTVYGTPTRKGHVRNCPCIRCRNRNNRKRGLQKQSKALRKLGGIGKFSPSDEENYMGPVRTEHKATIREAGPVHTAHFKVKAQSEAAKSIGDPRPFVGSFTAPGSNRTVFTIDDAELERVVFALAEFWGTA